MLENMQVYASTAAPEEENKTAGHVHNKFGIYKL